MGLHVGSQTCQPRINVTPLVDIVLVLLIVFIVLTPAAHAKVQLPKAKHCLPTGKERPVVLTLNADGMIRVEDPRSNGSIRELALDGRADVWQRMGSLDGRSVLIHADAQRPYRDIQALLDRLRECGAKEAQFATAHPKDGGAS